MKNCAASAVIFDMRTDDLIAPIGIDSVAPVFSWKIRSEASGWLQSAYRIIVRQYEKIMWDSGRVKDGASVGIVYAGERLASSTEYRWTVTVWDHTGNATRSESASFEMGLLGENPFGEAKWISYDQKPLFSGRKYTIDFDFIIENGNQGFCFGMEDGGTFLMWQVNTLSGNGKVLLRPHIKSEGNWVAFPGGPGEVEAVDVTDAIGYTAEELIGKRVHERIEVDGKMIKTYFGFDADSLKLASTYTHTAAVSLCNIGFRHNGGSRHDSEIARYGNIVIRDADGVTLYESDFAREIGFKGAEQCAVQDGMLSVGRVGGGEQICIRTDGYSLPVFRKAIKVRDDLVSARLYTSGLGVYESYLNGERIGRVMPDGSTVYHELKPGFTEAAKRKFYNTYDVTAMLQKGELNVLAAVVSHGWWSDGAAARYGNEDAYLAKLILTYADGAKVIIDTDETWKSAKASAVVDADIFGGESYDARIDEGWMRPDFDVSQWQCAKLNHEFDGSIGAWKGSPITVRRELERSAQSVIIYKGTTDAAEGQFGKIKVIRNPKSGSFTLNAGETALIDFGQNFAGREAFSVEGERGTKIIIRHGETLNDRNGLFSRGNDGPEGSLYNANYRGAAATTRYILSGNGVETYSPIFTFYGFRYIEIIADREVVFHDVTGQVVTSVEKETGFMETSDRSVNQLISNIRWGQYSNYLSVPTDCPQRDERQGWTADTQVFAKAGCYMAFSKSFLTKFLGDLRDSQRFDGALPGTAPTGCYHGGGWGGTGWADAGIILPHLLYTLYGDKTVISENLAMMQRYVDGFLASTEGYGPRPIWGDWLAYESNDAQIQEMLGVAFYAWDAKMMAEMAEAIDLPEEAEKYRALYEEEKQFFISHYVNTNGTLIRGEQSVCAYALYLELLPDEASAEAVKTQLVRNIERNGNRLQTGFLGTAILLPTLTKIGRSDIAYSLLLQHDNPSWLYSVDQGATTIWERWNSYTIKDGFGDVGMNSFNHYAYGAVAAWMFDTMAGIAPDARTPAFKKIALAPKPDRRLSVKASYDSAYGVISAESRFERDEWHYTCTLPANTTAEIKLPAPSPDAIKVNGKASSELTREDGIVFVGMNGNEAQFEARSGRYDVRVMPK